MGGNGEGREGGREALFLCFFFLKELSAVSREALYGISIFHQSPDCVSLSETILAFLVSLPF